MNIRPLGCTSLHVSELCLGTLQFGWKTDERTSCALIDRFRDAGGNFLQATSLLGPPPPATWIAAAPGEASIGHWLRRNRSARRDIVLSTRLLARDSRPATRSFASDVVTAVEASLERLGTDHLDLLLCEWTGSGVPPDDLAGALQTLVQAGHVRHAGVSGWPAWRIMETHDRLRQRTGLRIAAIQADFSLLDREPFTSELSLLAEEHRFGFLARSPLGGGALVESRPPAMPGFAERTIATRDAAQVRPVRDVLHAVAQLRSASHAQTALAWVLAHAPVTSAVVGVTSPDQLTALIAATRRPLTADELRVLNSASTPSAAHRRDTSASSNRNHLSSLLS